MESLEIGIPCYRNLQTALQKSAELREGGFRGRIHISVNNPSEEDIALSLEANDPNMDVTLQNGDLGLYGNFRYLANKAAASHFMWLALDHSPDWAVVGAIKATPTDSTLVYSRHFLSLTAEDQSRNFVYGPIDPFDVRNVFNFDPSAIFGAWDTQWLQKTFPATDFDWLDSFLLTAAHLEGRIRLVQGNREIGLQLGKRPHNVAGSHHRIWGWFYHCTMLILGNQRFDLLPSFFVSYLGRLRMILRQIALRKKD